MLGSFFIQLDDFERAIGRLAQPRMDKQEKQALEAKRQAQEDEKKAQREAQIQAEEAEKQRKYAEWEAQAQKKKQEQEEKAKVPRGWLDKFAKGELYCYEHPMCLSYLARELEKEPNLMDPKSSLDLETYLKESLDRFKQEPPNLDASRRSPTHSALQIIYGTLQGRFPDKAVQITKFINDLYEVFSYQR